MKSSALFAARYDGVISQPNIRLMYGDSGYFNVGYWVDGIAKLVPACHRMVDELAAVVPEDARSIVDVGCGLGATTRRLATRFPRARVIGGNISLWQLATARARGVRDAAVMDAVRLPIASGAADAVVSVEAAQHFDTRADFFAEARRVLRPGGTIAVADMLFTTKAIGDWMLPSRNTAVTTSDYANVLGEAGFGNVVVRDITAVSWRPFCAAMREAGVDTDAVEDSLACYVIATARRS